MSLYGSVGVGPLRVGASTRDSSNNGISFLVCLIVVAPFYFAIKFWYVVLPIAIFLLFTWGIMRSIEQFGERTPGLSRKEALARRAEEQHEALMNGDELTGTYGEFMPMDLS